jgi:glutamate-1-semialdehyde aminotransferase
MEVHRNEEPRNHFLSKVRKLASDKNIVLIFDECTSGFRKTFGGLHKYYKITPDIAIFGKALGNGYAINAVIGKKSIMDKTNNTFISSTFWTERIGPTAALATLREMEKIKSWDVISSIGKKIKKQWSSISKINSVSIDIQGIDALPNFIYKSKNHLKYKTFVTQEMLKRKILASNSIYCSISHTDKVMNKYFDLLNEVFYKISKIEKNELNLEDCLKSPVCLSGLRNIK